MKEAIPRRRGVSRRVSRERTLLSAVVIGGFMLAGCSHSSPQQHAPANGGGRTPYERALTIAQCMRENGDPSFPDPGSNGAFPASADKNKSAASFRAAVKACQGLPVSGVGNPPF
jgi:hypothetical protein